MRRTLMTALLLAMTATAAVASVPPGSLIQATDSRSTLASRATTTHKDGFVVPDVIGDASNPGSSGWTGTGPRPTDQAQPLPANPASQPVPEPGTMAMASMGLLALGATLRRRRRRAR